MPILILKRLLMCKFSTTKLLLAKRYCGLDIIPVHDQAHRFDATKRTYEYHINTFKDAFRQEHSWYFHQPLDINLMNEAGQLLFKHTDFQCFLK
jgi:tRNA U38,U39,U40 pseudouridine synthase TruA